MGLNSITNYSNSISKTKRVHQRKKIGNLLNSNKMAKHPNLNRLPIQLDYKIYSNLEIDDLFNLSLVSNKRQLCHQRIKNRVIVLLFILSILLDREVERTITLRDRR